MMKTTTSLFTLSLLALVFPGPALANMQPVELITKSITKLPASVKLPNKEAVCSTLATTKEKLNAAVESKEKAVSAFVDEFPQNLEDERNARDAKLGEARSEMDQKRSEWYAELEARAKNDDQEDAVEKYKKIVEEAVDDRRESVDAAIAEFRKGVDALALKRSSGMQSARDNFKHSVEVATKKLETDCTNGVSTDTLSKDFKAGLKIARDKLAADKKSATAIEAEIKALAEIRKKTMATALAAFQTELKAANEALQTAFTGGE